MALLNSLLKPLDEVIARRLLLWLISFVRPEDLVEAINNGEDIITLTVRCLLRHHYEHLKKHLTLERVIEDLREERPDLMSIILTMPNGMEWLRTNIEHVKKLAGG